MKSIICLFMILVLHGLAHAEPCPEGQLLVYRDNLNGIVQKSCEKVEGSVPRQIELLDTKWAYFCEGVGFKKCSARSRAIAEQLLKGSIPGVVHSGEGAFCHPQEPMYGLKELDGLILDFLKFKDRAKETMVKYRYELSIGVAVILSGLFYLYRLGIKTHSELANLEL